MNLTTLLLCFVSFFAILLTYFLYNIRKIRKHLEQHGIPVIEFGVGKVIWFIMGYGGSVVDGEEQLYKDATKVKQSSLAGVANLTGTPVLCATDLNLVKAIYVKDFDHFVNRRPFDHSNKYLQKMLFSTENEKWKGIRAKLSPIFTAAKIKRMFQIFKSSSERMDEHLKQQMNYPNTKSMDVDFLKIFSKYTMDVIANCAFGIDSKSFDVNLNEQSIFEKMGNQFVFKYTAKFMWKFFIISVSPKLANFFGIDLLDGQSQDYFVNVITDVIKRRRQTGETRDDFLQLMLEVQQGIVKADEESNEIMHGAVGESEMTSTSFHTQGDKLEFQDDHIIANGMLFLMAGFDTTQSTLLFTIYALALEQQVQENLYEEVVVVMEKYNGQLTYDAVNEMKYLDLVVNESLRMYPPATRAERSCTKDYPVPGTSFVIEKGSIVIVPIQGIHHDPLYFPNPNKFIPERFTPENKAVRHSFAYMPFGHGSRSCIGNRFALVKVKTAIAQLVKSFHFTPCSRTKIPLEYDRNPNVKPKDAMWLNISIR